MEWMGEEWRNWIIPSGGWPPSDGGVDAANAKLTLEGCDLQTGKPDVRRTCFLFSLAFFVVAKLVLVPHCEYIYLMFVCVRASSLGLNRNTCADYLSGKDGCMRSDGDVKRFALTASVHMNKFIFLKNKKKHRTVVNVEYGWLCRYF